VSASFNYPCFALFPKCPLDCQDNSHITMVTGEEDNAAFDISHLQPVGGRPVDNPDRIVPEAGREYAELGRLYGSITRIG
jgi:hypothetical protein